MKRIFFALTAAAFFSASASAAEPIPSAGSGSDPVSDTAKAVLTGHITVLGSREPVTAAVYVGTRTCASGQG